MPLATMRSITRWDWSSSLVAPSLFPAATAFSLERDTEPAFDFASMAKSFGVHGEGPVSNPAELRPAIERGGKYVKEKQLPYLVDVIAEPR